MGGGEWCGVVGGGRPRLGKGRPLALARHRVGDFDLRFFLADVLEMGWLVKCWTLELKGWRERPDFQSPAQNPPTGLYPKFHLTFNSH